MFSSAITELLSYYRITILKGKPFKMELIAYVAKAVYA